MSWNYRIVKTTVWNNPCDKHSLRGDKDCPECKPVASVRWGMHEVYYGLDPDDDTAISYTVDPESVDCYKENLDSVDDDPVEVLRVTLMRMLAATDKPVIDRSNE